MSVLYLVEQGTILKKNGARVVVARQGETVLEMPVFHLERVLVFGNIQITAQALGFLMEKGIDVAFFSMYGRLRGSVVSALSKNIFLRLAQHAAWQDQTKKITLARSIVSAKIKNQHFLMQRYHWKYIDNDLREALDALNRYRASLDSKQTIGEISGIEGISSRIYFSQFKHMLRSGFSFEGRTRQPPTDPVNSLLSLGYSMLTSEISAMLEGASFDPYLGFLHGVRYGRKSLALDLIEQFRGPIVDSLTLQLCNKRIFSENDFVRRVEPEAETQKEGVYLAEDSLKEYFARLEEHMSQKNKEGKSWREIIRQNIDNLSKAILRQEPFTPFHLK